MAKAYRSVNPIFAFRVDADTKLHFEQNDDIVVEDPKHVALCDSYVPEHLMCTITDEEEKPKRTRSKVKAE